MIALSPLLISVMAELGYSVVNNFISGEGAKKLATFAIDLATSVSDAHTQLDSLLREIRRKKEAAEAAGEVWVPDEAEVQDLVNRINARGAEDGSYGEV